MGKRGVQHWKKRKAIAAYLFRRRGWAILLDFEDSIILSELIAITAPGSSSAAYSDSLGFTEDVSVASTFDKTEVVTILEDVALALNKEATADSLGASDTITTNFNSIINDTTADGLVMTEQLDMLFELTATQDSLGVTDTYSNHLTKVLADGFILDETFSTAGDLGVIKSNTLSFATDIHNYILGKGLTEDISVDELVSKSMPKTFSENVGVVETNKWSLYKTPTETVTLGETLGKTIFKTFSDGFGIAETNSKMYTLGKTDGIITVETINSKEFSIVKSDGVTVDHSETADVVVSGTFANRKLGGEPFNTLTFN